MGRPLVLTSGNVSDEPIAYRDGDARKRLGGIAGAFLTHDRGIHIRTDDSVARQSTHGLSAPAVGWRRPRNSRPPGLMTAAVSALYLRHSTVCPTEGVYL